MPILTTTAAIAGTATKAVAAKKAKDKLDAKTERRETAGNLLAVAGDYSGKQSERRKGIKEQNQDGYKYGGSVSQTGRGRSRTGAPAQNGTAKRAWLFGGLALVTWLAVRR